MAGLLPGASGIFVRCSRRDEPDRPGLLLPAFERICAAMNCRAVPNVVVRFDVQWEDAEGPVDRELDGFGLGCRF